MSKFISSCATIGETESISLREVIAEHLEICKANKDFWRVNEAGTRNTNMKIPKEKHIINQFPVEPANGCADINFIAWSSPGNFWVRSELEQFILRVSLGFKHRISIPCGPFRLSLRELWAGRAWSFPKRCNGK